MTWAARWTGLPAETFGREACYGLVRQVLAAEFAIHWPTFAAAPEDPALRAHLISRQRPLLDLEEVGAATAGAGDVALMTEGRHACHLGILAAPGWLLHLADARETVCVRLDHLAVRRRLVGIYRPRAGADAARHAQGESLPAG